MKHIWYVRDTHSCSDCGETEIHLRNCPYIIQQLQVTIDGMFDKFALLEKKLLTLEQKCSNLV